MDILSHLLILALFSLHQYVPREKMAEKYFESTVHPQSLEMTLDSRLVVAAAHQTCRHFFADAQQDFQMNEQELVNFVFSLLEQKQTSLSEFEATPDAVKKTIRDICRKDFRWTAFPDAKLQQILVFLKTELLVLNKQDLLRFGQMDLFGKTSLYDRNGTSIGSLYPSMDRWLSLSQISPNVPKALIAAEDKTFMTHKGVELSSLSRILFQMKSESDSVSGGSTLTMQLLKNFYFMDRGFNSPEAAKYNSYRAQSILRKVREWFWAKPFEDFLATQYPSAAKEKILEYYLNLMDFGPQIRGIDRASYVFFNKQADQLTIADSAFIATLFKAPQKYSLAKNYSQFTQPRREYVLQEMSKLSWQESLLTPITQEELASALKEPLPIWTQVQNSSPLLNPETLHLQTLARDSILGFYEKSPNVLPVESEIISTIDFNLQNIVYNVVRSKLDEYDSARNTFSRVEAARDDRTRTAGIEIRDIPYQVNSLLSDYKKSLADSSVEIAFVLKSAKNIKDAKFFFSPLNKLLKDNESLSAVFNKKDLAASMGTLFVVSTNDPSCQPPTTESSSAIDILEIPKPCLVPLVNSEAQTAVEVKIKELIKIQFLLRMKTYAHREEMIPALFDPDTQHLVILQQTEETNLLVPISLSKDHHSRFSEKVRTGQFRSGHVFWVSTKDSASYQLETSKLQAAVVVMDSETGEVYAHFGGYRPETSRFFDRSRTAKRQPGSTLKPWLYYLALTKGFDENSLIRNQGVSFPMKSKVYVPDNFPGSSSANEVVFKEAFQSSYNKAAVGLLTDERFGPDHNENLNEFVNFLTDIQIYSKETVLYEPSIVLGAQEVSTLDLTSSFTFFANGKYIVKPTFFRSIKNGQGISIFNDDQPTTLSVPHSDNQWAVEGIQRLMIGVANNGTARKLLNFPFRTLGLKSCDGAAFGIIGQICFAGKTGTSSDLKDNWFVGTSRNFTIGVWIGYDYRESTGATGGELALPIFMDIVEKGREFLPPIEPILSF